MDTSTYAIWWTLSYFFECQLCHRVHHGGKMLFPVPQVQRSTMARGIFSLAGEESEWMLFFTWLTSVLVNYLSRVLIVFYSPGKAAPSNIFTSDRWDKRVPLRHQMLSHGLSFNFRDLNCSFHWIKPEWVKQIHIFLLFVPKMLARSMATWWEWGRK